MGVSCLWVGANGLLAVYRHVKMSFSHVKGRKAERRVLPCRFLPLVGLDKIDFGPADTDSNVTWPWMT